MSVTVKVTGLKKLEDKLRRLSIEFSEDFKKQVKESGQNIATNAKKFAPVDTGRLRASIRAEAPTDNGLSREITANVNYAAFVELGTSKQSPQPYLGPAFRLEQARFQEKLIAGINRRAGGR